MTFSCTKFDLWCIIMRLAYKYASAGTEDWIVAQASEENCQNMVEMLMIYLCEWNST